MRTSLILLFALFFTTMSTVFAQNIQKERFESVDNATFKEALASEEFILLDIRTVEEYENGHIDGAKLVEYNDGDIDATLKLMPKDHKYLVYCGVGVRSKVAMKKMEELGFKYVLELDKGLEEWE